MTPSRQRILQRTPATLSWSPVDADGEVGVDPGTVTVTVTNAAGTALVTDAATTGLGTAARTYALAATHTALLDVLTVTWEVSNVTVGVTYADVVGGYYFTLAELRSEEPSVAGPTYTDATLIRHRAEVESSFESWTGMAWVPRFTVVDTTASPNGSLLSDVFAIRSVRWYRSYTNATEYTEATADQLALVRGTTWGTLEGGYLYGRVVAGVEHGQNQPPPDLKRVAMRYCRKLAERKIGGLSDRATSYTTPEGMTVNVGRIGTDWRPTGDEIIDEVLRRPDVDHRAIGVA